MQDQDFRQDEPEVSARKQKDNKVSGFLGIGLAVLFATAAFFSGIQIGTGLGEDSKLQAGLFSSWFGPSSAPKEEVKLDTFWKVWRLMEDKFVAASSTEAVTSEDKIFGATKGMVDSFNDPYSVFLPPEDAEQFGQDIAGNFGGVGMEVGLRDGLVTVISPLPESPAKKSGILSGDVIVTIDGTETEGMSIDEAVRLIRGEKGTDVTMELYREGESELVEVTVTRDTITIPTIETSIDGDVFIIELYNFNALAEMKFQQALREFKLSGADKMVLDLRGNPGGYLQGAVSIASYFLPAGEVVVRENFGDSREEKVYRSTGKIIHQFNPDNFVVLVNQGSASASEIVAGALKEHNVATLIGDRTFGKGSVQELVDLPDGSSLKVTIARWLTPNGTSFSEVGLEPNVLVERTPEQMLEGEDTQKEAAFKWLAGNHDIGDPVAKKPF